MKKFLYPLFAVLTSVALVLGGFSFSAQQGRYCAFEVQCAEAAVPLTAPYIFGALLGCFGVSVAGYAAANGEDTATALDNAWASFQSFASSDVVSDLTSAFNLVTSAVTPIGALNLSSSVMHAISSWLLDSFFVDSTASYPSTVSIDGIAFPVSSFVSSVAQNKANSVLANNVFLGYLKSPEASNVLYLFASSDASLSIKHFPPSSDSFLITGTLFGCRGNGYVPYSFSPGNQYTLYCESDCYFSPYAAGLLSSSYQPSYSSSLPQQNSVLDTPTSISNAISAHDAAALASAVSDAISGLNLNVDSAVVENPAWSDVFGDIPATLESIQEAISSGFAGVLEGVQTFFRPVVDFFAPLDIRDSDDIGELVISNVSKEHTFTAKFPFCLVNDYKSLYENAISPAGGSSDYPTPGYFVVKLPAMNGLNSQPITLDMTYIFTNKYMGLTLGQISQLFVAIACLAMFLHWVGDMINVVKSPNYGYVTVEGESVGRGR